MLISGINKPSPGERFQGFFRNHFVLELVEFIQVDACLESARIRLHPEFWRGRFVRLRQSGAQGVVHNLLEREPLLLHFSPDPLRDIGFERQGSSHHDIIITEIIDVKTSDLLPALWAASLHPAHVLRGQ